MDKPIVNIIDDQKVENKEAIIDNWEAEQLLRKYGYESQHISSRQEVVVEQPSLTFEEMVRIEEEKQRNKTLNQPKPATFNSNNGYDSEIKYSSDDDTGFGFKIQIISDMPLPKY